MATISFTERVNAPVEQIFAVMTNIPEAHKNISGISNIEMMSKGGVGVNTRWKETRVMFGKQAIEEMWISEYELDSKYVVEADSCGAHFRTEFKFKKVDNYTTDVTMEMTTKPVTLTAKLMSPLSFLMKGTLVKAIKKDLDDARRVCETQYDEDSVSSVKLNI